MKLYKSFIYDLVKEYYKQGTTRAQLRRPGDTGLIITNNFSMIQRWYSPVHTAPLIKEKGE